ncbi:hypothetical protein [Actinopolyspora halophila]|nr:hypothetical protein [Actinopolyspora halophila]
MVMNSGSVEAFHVVVACQDTPPARKICRSVSIETGTTEHRWTR